LNCRVGAVMHRLAICPLLVLVSVMAGPQHYYLVKVKNETGYKLMELDKPLHMTDTGSQNGGSEDELNNKYHEDNTTKEETSRLEYIADKAKDETSETENEKIEAENETIDAENEISETDDETIEAENETSETDDEPIEAENETKPSNGEEAIGIADGTMSLEEYFAEDKEHGSDYMDSDETDEDTTTFEYYLTPDA